MEGIEPTDIRPGDVLLFHGDSFVSWAIRRIDGSEVNHVAIALRNGRLAEAGGTGLKDRPIPTAFSDDDYMLVRRHGTTGSLDPVLDTADTYLANGNFYAYQQIVLLAILGLTRRIPAWGLARRLIRSACDHAARALMDLLPVGASWMICSEYVYRCFDEASNDNPDPYRVLIDGIDYALAIGESETWAEWALAAASTTPVTIEGSLQTLGFDPAAAEAELEPLIAEWERYAGSVPDDPLPDSVTEIVGATIDEASAAQAQVDEVPDAVLLESILRFAETFKVVRASTPGVPVSFGLEPATVPGAAVKGALKGLLDLTVDPNFVTPADMLRSSSFGETTRAR